MAFNLFYCPAVSTSRRYGAFKYGYVSHFMSEKEHYQENAENMEEIQGGKMMKEITRAEYEMDMLQLPYLLFGEGNIIVV